MRVMRKWLACVSLLSCLTTASVLFAANDSHIGYLYPAGAQQGREVIIIAGGQSLRGAGEVYVSGQGVRAEVVKYIRPFPNLNKERRQAIQNLLKNARAKYVPESSVSDSNTKPAPGLKTDSTPKKTDDSKNKEENPDTEKVELPDHPLLYDLENKSLRELAHIANIIFTPRSKLQPNRQTG